MKTVEVTVTSRNGWWQLDAVSAGRLKAAAEAHDGETWTLTVEAPKRQRSNQQNRYMHSKAFFGKLVYALGYSELGQDDPKAIDELKRDLMGTCFGWVETPMGGKRPSLRTSEMDTWQASQFFEWVARFAADYGVYVEMPQERAS